MVLLLVQVPTHQDWKAVKVKSSVKERQTLAQNHYLRNSLVEFDTFLKVKKSMSRYQRIHYTHLKKIKLLPVLIIQTKKP